MEGLPCFIGLVCAAVFGVICGMLANTKGRNVVGWSCGGVVSGLFCGIFGFLPVILLVVLPNLNEQQAREQFVDRENRRLREQLRQERMKNEAFRQHTTARLDAHDDTLGTDTRQLTADQPTEQQLLSVAPDDAVDSDLAQAASEGAGGGGGWYYEQHGNTRGPMNRSELVDMIHNGAIDANTLIWNEALVDWKPIGEIQQFSKHFGRTA